MATRTIFDIHHIFPRALWGASTSDPEFDKLREFLTDIGLDESNINLDGNQLALLNARGEGLFARIRDLPDAAKKILGDIGWGVNEHTNNHPGYNNFRGCPR